MDCNGQHGRQQLSHWRTPSQASYQPSHAHYYPVQMQQHVSCPGPSTTMQIPMLPDYEIMTPSQGDMSQALPSQTLYMIPVSAPWVSPEFVSSPSGPSPDQSRANRPSPVRASSPSIEVARTAREPAQLVSPLATTRISDNSPPSGQASEQEHPPATGFPKARPLGPLRTVHDTVTGLPEYTLNPFCPSNMEFQRRGEDEISKLLHLVVQYASQLKLQIKYEDPRERGQGAHNDATRAVGRCSLDFRWLMKHLEYNRSVYSRGVFNSTISEVYIHQCCRGLRVKGDLLAHKQHLQDNLQEETEGGQKKGNGKSPIQQSKKRKCGTVSSINEFFAVAIEFAKKVEDGLKDHVPSINTHRRNLEAIASTFQEFVEYRAIHHRNTITYDNMSKAQQKQVSRRVLDMLSEMWEESEEGQQLIAIAFAARCNISIKELTK